MKFAFFFIINMLFAYGEVVLRYYVAQSTNTPLLCIYFLIL